MKACPVGLAGLVVAVREPGASFLHGIFDGGRRVHDACACAAARGQHRLDGILPGLPRRCAARSAEAAHAAASSSDEPPRKPWRGPCALYFGFSTASDVCRSLRGPWYLCFVCGHTCNRACGEEHRDKNSDRDDLVTIEYDVVTNTIL